MWTSSGKIAATGIRATRWISYHGIALNVCPDLSPFSAIVPCGIDDRPVTSVRKHGERAMSGTEASAWDSDSMLLAEYSAAIVEAFAEHFGVRVADPLSELTLPSAPV